MAFSIYKVVGVACLSRSWFVYAPWETRLHARHTAPSTTLVHLNGPISNTFIVFCWNQSDIILLQGSPGLLLSLLYMHRRALGQDWEVVKFERLWYILTLWVGHLLLFCRRFKLHATLQKYFSENSSPLENSSDGLCPENIVKTVRNSLNKAI